MAEHLIYLDNNATTRVDPRVLEAMLPYFSEVYGNAASRAHVFGWQAEEAVETAREQIAALIGATPPEIVLTSGATESDNLAWKGVAEAYADKGDHCITVATEHPAVLDSARHLERLGKRVTYLAVDPDGLVSLDDLRLALTDRTILVSVMLANNEIGTIAPIAEIGALCRERGVLFHTDATQAVGKIPVDVDAMHIDLMSFSAHKMYGPKGVGALYMRRRSPRVRITAQMDGGGQERGRRSGTLNVPGIVGFGAAAALCRSEMERDGARMLRLRDRLTVGIREAVPDAFVNGHPTLRVPNTVNIAFPGMDADALLANLPNVALSSGSACTSASVEPSHVLIALGRAEAVHSSLRFSLSRFTTEEEIESVVNQVVRAVQRLRELTPCRNER